MDIIVIRVGHRIVRDVRATTHCALAARALGAKGITICGEEDKEMIEGIKKTAERWGGSFYITYSGPWQKPCSDAKRNGYLLVHATMYGIPLQKQLDKLRKLKKIAIIIGSQKVPREIFDKSDYNIAVTSQPHSEIAALAIMLHELFNGKELEKKFPNAKIEIAPSERQKLAQKRA